MENVKNVLESQLAKRIKSLLWRASMFGVAAFVAFLLQNLNVLELPEVVTVFLGLVLGEVSKYLNSKKAEITA